MDLVLLIFFMLGLWHFIYEGILAPSLRLKLKYRLYAVRDELRWIRITQDKDFDGPVFKHLEERVNDAIARMPYIEPYRLYKVAQEVEHDVELKKQLQEEAALVESCKLTAVHDQIKHLYKSFGLAFLVNGGGWAPYIVPILMVVFFLGELKKFLKESLYVPKELFDNHATRSTHVCRAGR